MIQNPEKTSAHPISAQKNQTKIQYQSTSVFFDQTVLSYILKEEKPADPVL